MTTRAYAPRPLIRPRAETVASGLGRMAPTVIDTTAPVTGTERRTGGAQAGSIKEPACITAGPRTGPSALSIGRAVEDTRTLTETAELALRPFPSQTTSVPFPAT